MQFRTFGLTTILALGVGATSVLAGENGTGESESLGRNKIEFTIGNTHAEHGDNAFTFAASYNYRFSEQASVGVLVEHAFDPLDSWVVGVPFKLYPGEGWVLTAMPGIELEGGEEEPLFRIGVGYEFELDGYSLTPEINADYVDSDVAIVLGLSIGFSF